jgi:hypothetical protein
MRNREPSRVRVGLRDGYIETGSWQLELDGTKGVAKQMGKIKMKTFAAVTIICTFSLSCSFGQQLVLYMAGLQGQVDSLTQIANPIEDTSTATNTPASVIAPTQGASQAEGNTCDATQYLGVTSEVTRQETNQYGTRLCEYSLTIRNTSEDAGIWVYFYQHDKDGYAHTEKSRWMGKVLVGPGTDTDWSGSVYLYTDQDADGPLMSVPERLAGVYDIPECAGQQRDESYFEQISVPVDPVCPME